MSCYVGSAINFAKILQSFFVAYVLEGRRYVLSKLYCICKKNWYFSNLNKKSSQEPEPS